MPGFGCLGGDDGREHGGLAVGGEDGAVGLARDLAGFEGELAATPVEFNTMDIEHCDFLSWFSRRGESHEQDGETLSRAACRERQQRPAILPWPSCLR